MPHSTLFTARLELVPITVAIVEAVMRGDRDHTEALVEATMPPAWPGLALIERAFSAKLDLIRAQPDVRLWGDRVMLSRSGPRRVIGSVVFHGAPGDDGVVEVAYGVEEDSQQQGYATEAVLASVEWAFEDAAVRMVRATTPSWHVPSRRVLEKCGFRFSGTSESEAGLGELYEFERAR